MASFEEAYAITMGHEGGYVDDPEDAGGETYKGVSRRFHPGWEGWSIVDAHKSKENFRKKLKSDSRLQGLVHKFYKQHFWDPFLGDEIPSQDVADEMFDTGVNMSVGRAVEFLQESLNLLNRNGKLYADIGVDGGFGSITLGALKSYLNADPPGHLLKLMNVLQGMHYIKRMKEHPGQEKYARGWLKRVLIQKT